MSEWIDIKEEYPELNSKVFVLCDMYEPTFCRDRGIVRSLIPDVATYYKMSNCDIKQFTCEESGCLKVTHWMYIPEL